MSSNFFHTISALTTIILVHVNNGSYTASNSLTSLHPMYSFAQRQG